MQQKTNKDTTSPTWPLVRQIGVIQVKPFIILKSFPLHGKRFFIFSSSVTKYFFRNPRSWYSKANGKPPTKTTTSQTEHTQQIKKHQDKTKQTTPKPPIGLTARKKRDESSGSQLQETWQARSVLVTRHLLRLQQNRSRSITRKLKVIWLDKMDLKEDQLIRRMC